MYPRDDLWISIGYRVLPGKTGTQATDHERPNIGQLSCPITSTLRLLPDACKI